MSIERLVGDALADGKMTDGDAEAVLEFAQFLRDAGPPRHPDDHAPGCRSPLDRWIADDRYDLIAYAMGCSEDEARLRVAGSRQ